MEFRIADSFLDSLDKLSTQEKEAAKTTAFDLQVNPAHPGLQFHRLDRAKDPSFWSIRVNRDIRLIIHRTDQSLLICYVGHHDEAYRWAERRKLEVHPKTGAAQIVEIRETIREITIPTYVVEEEPASILFEDVSEDDLLKYGVPVEWLEDVQAATEDTLLELTDHLPKEAAEALLELATGGTPPVPVVVPPDHNPFEHPDALRRFRVMANVEELKLALEYPWEKWTVFLHPDQKKTVEAHYSGPARVYGSAGTGKTIVALHRAVHLANSNPESRVLLTTFSDPLANMLKTKLHRLCSSEPRTAEQIEVYSLNRIGERLYGYSFGDLNLADREAISDLVYETANASPEHAFSQVFLMAEWDQVVDAWQLQSWEEYRDVLRIGRKTRLPESRRKAAWSIFEEVRSEVRSKELITHSEMFHRLAEYYQKSGNPPFNFVVIDEAQDVSVAQLKFLAAIAGGQPNGLFFAGDLGQRIFQQPFSWLSLGVDVRGRSQRLRVNYRTSHQIRTQADRLLDPEMSDVDGIVEERKGTVSVFNGPDPEFRILDSEEYEIAEAGQWIQERLDEGFDAHEIGVIVRSDSEIARGQETLEGVGVKYSTLGEDLEIQHGHISLCTMHLAKGLEFRAVVVMACDDEVIPLQERIETVADESDLEEVYNTERHLLYVSCTRARDSLIVTGVTPASEFLEDFSS